MRGGETRLQFRPFSDLESTVCICACVFAHTCVCVHMHAYMYVLYGCVLVCVHRFVCRCVHLCTRIQRMDNNCVYVCVACMFVCWYVCIGVYRCVHLCTRIQRTEDNFECPPLLLSSLFPEDRVPLNLELSLFWLG